MKPQHLLKKTILTFFLASLPCFALALENTYPTINGTTIDSSTGLSGFVRYAFNLAVAMGAVLAFLIIVYEGSNIINAGGEMSKINTAKSRIFNSILGLLIILLSYIILTTINPDLIVIKDISVSKIVDSIKPTPTPVTPEPGASPQAITFQEVPIGNLVENILARNISCFDKDRNLIDCKTKSQLASKPKDEYDPSNSIFYCYQYDGGGDKQSIYENRDRFYCLQEMEKALQAKVATLMSYNQTLYQYMQSCSCSACDRGYCTVPGGCPSTCKSYCHACGSPRETYTDCYGESPFTLNNEPCSSRSSIDTMREQIKQLINGGSKNDPYYNEQMDPKKNTKFMTLMLFIEKIEQFKTQLDADANELFMAERMIESPSAERLSLAELHNLMEKDKSKSIGVSSFGDYKAVTKYCRDFNCTKYGKNDLCSKTELTDLFHMCKIENSEERYFMDGDPATFYYSTEYNSDKDLNNYEEKDNTCTINVSELTEQATKGVSPSGLIPIGQTSDDSRLYVKQVDVALSSLIEKIQNLFGPELNNIDSSNTLGNASNGDAIYSLPEDCKCSNCHNRMVDYYVCCSCCSSDCTVSKSKCTSCSCTTPEDRSSEGIRICPYDAFTIRANEIKAISKTIDGAIIRVADLINSENLFEEDMNRSNLFNKLSISRFRLEGCVRGYGVSNKDTGLKTRIFSCQEGMKYSLLQELTILPHFPYPENSKYLNCYPYNSKTLTDDQKKICAETPLSERGPDGVPKCLNFIQDIMDDFYCCNQISK